MKWLLASVFLTVIGVGNISAQKVPEGGYFDGMRFEVALDKSTYVLSEPLMVSFRLTNETDAIKHLYPPNFVHDSVLLVRHGGETSTIGSLSNNTGGSYRFERILRPMETIAVVESFGSGLAHAFFPEPGTYQVQFVLHSGNALETITSNRVSVTIQSPVGLDKDAFDFMQKHQDFFGLSSWGPTNEKTRSLLEAFVGMYGESVYGEDAILSLGTCYLVREEFDKAKAELEKIQVSKRESIATEAKRLLAEIGNKKKGL